MRITGEDIWGELADRTEGRSDLRRSKKFAGQRSTGDSAVYRHLITVSIVAKSPSLLLSDQ